MPGCVSIVKGHDRDETKVSPDAKTSRRSNSDSLSRRSGNRVSQGPSGRNPVIAIPCSIFQLSQAPLSRRN